MNEVSLLRSLMAHVGQVESSAGILLYSSETKRRKSHRERQQELIAESAEKVAREIDHAEPYIITRDGMPAAQWILGLKHDLRNVQVHAAIFAMPRYDMLHARDSVSFHEFASVVKSLSERAYLLRDLYDRAEARRTAETSPAPPAIRPVWDKARRTLTFDGAVVKIFRRFARNQFLVLDGFEESGWPDQLDDPLPGGCNDKVQRLNETVKSLNNQNGELRIRFSANGSGTGFCWAPEKKSRSPRSTPTVTRNRP